MGPRPRQPISCRITAGFCPASTIPRRPFVTVLMTVMSIMKEAAASVSITVLELLINMYLRRTRSWLSSWSSERQAMRTQTLSRIPPGEHERQLHPLSLSLRVRLLQLHRASACVPTARKASASGPVRAEQHEHHGARHVRLRIQVVVGARRVRRRRPPRTRDRLPHHSGRPRRRRRLRRGQRHRGPRRGGALGHRERSQVRRYRRSLIWSYSYS